MPSLQLETPLGPVTIREERGAIVGLDWVGTCDGLPAPTPLLGAALARLRRYFHGEALCFDLSVNPSGTLFQRRVWAAMRAIPYGATRTYGDLARTLETSARAIGGACGANPIPIILPCHRVVAAAGAIGGYSGRGGLATKRALLSLEAAGRGR